MGNCIGSASDQAADDAISADMAEAREEEGQTHKLLLLGAGESGKSTMFKQMIKIYGKGFSQKDRKAYVPIIFRNTVASIEELTKQTMAAPAQEAWPSVCTNKDKAIAESLEFVKELKYEDGSMPADLVRHITVAWKSPAVQAVYTMRSEFQLNDSAKYFLDKIDTCCAAGYVPTDEDILRARVRTTGIVENVFEIDSNKFKMFDVGGQRNERKKWIHCFEDVTAVLFVAGISAYDQTLYEDEHVNRIDESLNLFENICNSRWFRDTSVILFLNKCDLFREKILRVPLETVFKEAYTDWVKSQAQDKPPEDEAEHLYHLGTSFLEQEFLKRNHFKKPIYCHVTCATDARNVQAVFSGVKDIVVRGALQSAGLLN